METQNCFVFRTDPSNFIRGELKRGNLRQGWSPPGTSLLDRDGKERDSEEWKQAYRDAWQVEPSPRRHGILRRMLNMKKGDLVFCPKVPDYAHFTIAKVHRSYKFDVTSSEKDFGHIIPVNAQRVVSNWHSDDSQMICELFQSAYFRPAVTQVQEHKKNDLIAAADRLLTKEDTNAAQSPDSIREQRYFEGRKEAADALMEYVNEKWGFDQFEAAVGEAFRRKGYEWLRSKSTRNGGDADHVFALPIPGIEEALDAIPLLIVQVKHKKGIATDDVDGIRQLVGWEPDSESEVVEFRVLFSSADDFTGKCKQLAEEHNVVLICGTEAGLFML